jgi:hypothetical protein
MKKITIALGLLSLSNPATECSFMRRVIPGALIAGASAYVGGLYYYKHLGSTMREMIQSKQDYVRLVAEQPPYTSYKDLTFKIRAIAECLRKNDMSKFQKTIFRMFGGDESELHNNMVNNAKQRVCDMIDTFFVRRIEALKSFYEARSLNHIPQIWQGFDDPEEKSLHKLQEVLQQAFPHISTTYVNDRYQQHLSETSAYALTQRSTCTPPETERRAMWGNSHYEHKPQRVKILIFACDLPSDNESMETYKLWNRVKPHIATVPLYENVPNANEGYYITLQDIAQCLKLSNPQQYEYLAQLSYHDRTSYCTSRAIQNFDGMFPFRIRNAIIRFNKEMLPERYDIETEPSERYSHNGSVPNPNVLIKLPIFIHNKETYTYAVNIYPFKMPSRQS